MNHRQYDLDHHVGTGPSPVRRQNRGRYFHSGWDKHKPSTTQHHTLQVLTLGGFGIVVSGRSIDTGK